MIVPVLGLVAVALLSLPIALRSRGRRLPPARWARLILACMVSGAALWEAALLLIGLPTVLRATHAGGLADSCVHVLGHLQLAGSPVAGWLAAFAAAWTGGGAWRARRRTRQQQATARVEPWLGTHAHHDGYDLVVLPCSQSVAISVAGSPPQVIVSAGLADTLPVEQFEVVLRHEAAHLANQHQRYLSTVAMVCGGLRYLPMTRRIAQLLATALERWADEEAATAPEDRALIRDALLSVVGVDLTEGVAAFASAATVLERLDALDVAPPERCIRPTVMLAAPAMALASVAVVALTLSHGEIGLLMAAARFCAA